MSYPAIVHPALTRPVRAGRTTRSWLTTVWAALAALAVCVVAIFYTPVEPPAAWRATESAVVSLGRHSMPGDGLTL